MARAELKPREAAQRLGIRLDNVYALIWAGKLEARRVDGRWLIPSEAVEARRKMREQRERRAKERKA